MVVNFRYFVQVDKNGGLFMNADAGFDKEEFKEVCRDKEIEANICPNERKKKETDVDY